MALFVTKIMSVNLAVVETSSHLPISAVYQYSGITAPGVTPHANNHTIKKTRNKLRIHSNLVIKMLLKSSHTIIRVKRQEINT